MFFKKDVKQEEKTVTWLDECVKLCKDNSLLFRLMSNDVQCNYAECEEKAGIYDKDTNTVFFRKIESYEEFPAVLMEIILGTRIAYHTQNCFIIDNPRKYYYKDVIAHTRAMSLDRFAFLVRCAYEISFSMKDIALLECVFAKYNIRMGDELKNLKLNSKNIIHNLLNADIFYRFSQTHVAKSYDDGLLKFYSTELDYMNTDKDAKLPVEEWLKITELPSLGNYLNTEGDTPYKVPPETLKEVLGDYETSSFDDIAQQLMLNEEPEKEYYTDNVIQFKKVLK